MAIAALVLGIVGLVISLVPCLGMYGLPLALLGVILGGLGIKKNPAQKGMAIAGLVCGLIGLIVSSYQTYLYFQAKEGLENMGQEIQNEIDRQQREQQQQQQQQQGADGE